MAKIDVSSIEGYAEMTAEQKVEALEKLNLPDPDYSGYVTKEQFDKKASEAAEYKRSLNARMSDEEKAKEERDQEMESLRTQVAQLQKEKILSTYKSSYMAQGYDEKLAEDTAKALAEGDTAKVFANQKKFLEAHDKEVAAKLMKNAPGMPGGSGSSEEGEDIELARRLAQEQVNGNKSFAEGMKHYL